jgi:uncharacterized protein YjeT (DUF2065 family)
MAEFLTALGLVAVIEGLVLALAPLHLERVLEALNRMDEATRRGLGLGLAVLGVAVVWAVRMWG